MAKKPYMDRVRDREEKIKNSDRLDPNRDNGPDEEGRYSPAMYPQVSSSEENASRQVGARLKGGITRRTRESMNTEPEDNPEEGGFRKGGAVKMKSGGMMKKNYGGMVKMKSGGSVRGAGAAQRGQGKMRVC